MLDYAKKTPALLAFVGTASILAATPTVLHAHGRGGGTATLSFDGVEKRLNVDCRGRAVAVSGVDNYITFTGDCPSLTVSGSGNQIEITLRPDAPVQVSGTDNVVTWYVNGRGKPRVSVTGVDNSVRRAP